MIKHLPPAHAWSSALIATVVGFGGTIALVVQAMRALGASVEQTGSAVTALCLGIAIGGAALTLKTRIPAVLAWSTPGAALLAATPPGIAWPTAIAVFLVAGALMLLLALIPVLGRLAARIPGSIASAMLAGVLLPFCLAAFRLGTDDWLLLAMAVGVFIVARRVVPLYALLLVLVAAISLALARGEVTEPPPGALFGQLLPTMPAGDVRAIIGLAIPLFLVTLVSQILPGLMVLRNAGYEPKPGLLILRHGGDVAAARALRRARGEPRGHYRGALHQRGRPSRPHEALDGGRDLCRLLSTARDLLAGAGAALPRAAARRHRRHHRPRADTGARGLHRDGSPRRTRTRPFSPSSPPAPVS